MAVLHLLLVPEVMLTLHQYRMSARFRRGHGDPAFFEIQIPREFENLGQSPTDRNFENLNQITRIGKLEIGIARNLNGGARYSSSQPSFDHPSVGFMLHLWTR